MSEAAGVPPRLGMNWSSIDARPSGLFHSIAKDLSDDWTANPSDWST